MTLQNRPASFALDISAFVEPQAGHIVQRRLSQLKEYYSDQATVRAILETNDPLIYEVWEVENENSQGGLSYGMTRILPGKVGEEFYLTRGHFHAGDRGDEIYVVLAGAGKLVVFTREGECEIQDMEPGNMYYVPGHLAHRTVNSGEQDLLFFTIWPPHLVHDYASIVETGFPKLVLDTLNGPQGVDNPAFNTQRV